MAKEETIVGLDLGTTNIRTVVAQRRSDEAKPQIMGAGQAPSSGIRRGAVVDVEETVSSINKSLEEAERASGLPIERAFVSIGGSHISSQVSKGVIAVSRADGEISEDDVERVISAAQAVSLPPNKEILHVIPRQFTVDGQQAIKDPVGMSGVRLEVDALIVEGSDPFIKNLTKCVHQAGIDIENLVLSPLAASKSVLSKRQKELGVVLLDIGGGTTGLVVFEEGDIVHTAVLPVGAGHITNDIAIGLRTSIDVAEKVKLEYGSTSPEDISKKDEINLSKFSDAEESSVLRRHLAEIIRARIQEIFDLVNKELKTIDRQRLLPAGAVLTGGGAKMPGIVDLAKEELGLPAQLGFPQELSGVIDKVDEPSFATAVGLVLWGLNLERKGKGQFLTKVPSIDYTISKMKRWFRGFLP